MVERSHVSELRIQGTEGRRRQLCPEIHKRQFYRDDLCVSAEIIVVCSMDEVSLQYGRDLRVR
jgi:hypothetical protein